MFLTEIYMKGKKALGSIPGIDIFSGYKEKYPAGEVFLAVGQIR
jgi:hypothetical protein